MKVSIVLYKDWKEEGREKEIVGVFNSEELAMRYIDLQNDKDDDVDYELYNLNVKEAL